MPTMRKSESHTAGASQAFEKGKKKKNGLGIEHFPREDRSCHRYTT